MPKSGVKRTASQHSRASHEDYSAVIIADMVTEVPTEPHHLAPLRRGSEQRKVRRHSSATKSETNLGFEHQPEDSEAAVVSVASSETVDVRMSGNHSDITRGVILNAAQFVNQQSDKTLAAEGKPRPLDAHIQIVDPMKEESAETDFKSMSVGRKVAFALSFVPSITFVLCFAVILPCQNADEKPCYGQLWTANLSNTALTSGLVAPGDVMFSSFGPEGFVLRALSGASGQQLWNQTTEASVHTVACGPLEDRANSEACLVAQDTGNMRLVNASNGHIFWRDISLGEGISAPPLLTPDCSGDGLQEVIYAQPLGLKVLFEGNIVYSVALPSATCDPGLHRVAAWQRDNSTDVLVVCSKGDTDNLISLPQNKWCGLYDKKTKGTTSLMLSRKNEALRASVLLPFNEGLFVWAGDDVTRLEANGTAKWSVSTRPHSKENRHMLFGTFVAAGGSQVALFSGDHHTQSQVTILDPKSGSIVRSMPSETQVAFEEVSLLHGEKKDFALLLKTKEDRDLATAAIARVTEVSAAIASILSSEQLNSTDSAHSDPGRLSQQLVLLPLDGGEPHLVDQWWKEGDSLDTKLTVVPPSELSDPLKVYIVETLSPGRPEMKTTIRSVRISNWDLSSSKASTCSIKH